MEDGNVVITNDDKFNSGSLTNLYGDRPARFIANGHELTGESSIFRHEPYEHRHPNIDSAQEEKLRKRINPLRIHLGKRPFVDNSNQYFHTSKKRKTFALKSTDTNAHTNAPRMPKLIPKRNSTDHSQFCNVTTQAESIVDNEQDKPVPRLVPKSQLLHYKKGKVEKGSQLKEYAQSLGLQPMVKFKCRKCCSMSFKTLAMLKEHQLVCRAQAKEPTLSPEAMSCPEPNSSGPSRVTRKVYLCSACGTYYENWNLFLHMREVHNRHICLFCLGMFSKAEKLSSHLSHKHNVKEFSFNSKEEFINIYNGTLYLMCCVCEEICSEQDDFFNHDCNNIKPKPVPVLVSKNSMKPNNVKSTKHNECSTNGPTTISKELPKPYNDKRDIIEPKFDITSHLQKAAFSTYSSEIGNGDTSIGSEISATTSKDTSNTVDSGMELESSDNRPINSPVRNNANSPGRTIHLPNGDDHTDHSEESNSPTPENNHLPAVDSIIKEEKSTCPPLSKEKECGIKLTLSLNSAKSPVIINSTVDPSVGQQNVNKPPSRLRRPPKRYEKEIPSDSTQKTFTPQPKTPSIKMTICDRADSPFVKTTIYENEKELTLQTVINNNLDSLSSSTESKQENAVKTTIYDNKLEDVNTLNRVPKLTVRVPKELLDKDSSSDYSSDSDISEKLTVDEMDTVINEQETPKEDLADKTESTENKLVSKDINEETMMPTLEIKENNGDLDPKIEPKIEPPEDDAPIEPVVEEPSIPVTELSLDRPIDKYPLKDLLKVFLASTVYNCIYCNHVRKIAVNCEQLSLHMVSQHRFAATVDSITAEELLPETITAKLKSGAPELSAVYINLDSYDSMEKCETVHYDQQFECFQCYFKTAIHKDLCLHNRKMHQKTILLCVMCKSNFYSYSELLCHLCPGTYDPEYEIKFRCCLCNVDSIPSQFRLMVHLRKIHHTCDVCLEFCQNQARLSNHVWKHKLHHLCYRCGIAYRNKLDITNHLFWKHGTESVLCKRCLQKKWPHVYHFCNPPAIFVCDECNLQFTKAVYLKVHKRLHSGEFPHVCTEEGCTEKFVSKKLLNKHILDHKKTQLNIDSIEEKPIPSNDMLQKSKEPIPVIDLVNDKPKEEAGSSEVKTEADNETTSKKTKKKKLKDKDALLLDVNLPALNLSESDSSDESDSGLTQVKQESSDEKPKVEEIKTNDAESCDSKILHAADTTDAKIEEKIETAEEQKPSEQDVLDIWDNFKKYQAKVEKQKEKTPPLVTIRKHVCESDHDYCLIPTDMNGEDDMFSSDKKSKNKKSSKKQKGDFSSSSSSSSDSDSSCSCGSNCSCSSSSGSSSSSSSDTDSSDDSRNEKKKTKKLKKRSLNRRISTGSNVDVMGNAETPILIPEKVEPPIAETDLETEESDTDEEFYDEHPQRTVDKLYEEKRNQLLMLTSVAPSDGGSISGETSRPSTPVPEEKPPEHTVPVDIVQEVKDQQVKNSEENVIKEGNHTKVKSTNKKKNKKKKKSKSSRKHGPINIPKEIIAKPEVEAPSQLPPNKITISLQSNTVQIPEASKPTPVNSNTNTAPTSAENKRASKRRRVPNKFYGYSSDEEPPPSTLSALKPQLPPKLEWRKEDLPSPVTSKVKKEVPSTVMTNRLYNYTDTIRLTAPIPDPEPPKILMNTESMESSDSDSSEEGNLEIYQPNSQGSLPIPPPSYLNSGTSSLPYAFERPPVREAREGESVYCYCRCPYDEVSEMIACDAEGCPIEWFHFECVGIMVPPKGRWYCPECRKNQNFPGYR